MPVVSSDIYKILFTVSRWLFPALAIFIVLFTFLWLFSESLRRRERIRNLPGSGTVGELVVLSGGRDLAVNTWFPVPREGVLGSVRSCDLVIPCPGVRAAHLDFSWQDGLGLLLYPRSGCEVLVNGVPVTCRSDPREFPLTHGSVLQIGSAVLRLHLFAALDTSPVFQPDPAADLPASGPIPAPAAPVVPVPMPMGAEIIPPIPPDQMSGVPGNTFSSVPDQMPPVPGEVPPFPSEPFPAETPDPMASVSPVTVPDPAQSAQSPAPSPADSASPRRPRRSDRWKEDWGE